MVTTVSDALIESESVEVISVKMKIMLLVMVVLVLGTSAKLKHSGLVYVDDNCIDYMITGLYRVDSTGTTYRHVVNRLYTIQYSIGREYTGR